MADIYVSRGELLAITRREGFPVDATVPTTVLRTLLGGVKVHPGTPTPIRDAAVEMQAFVDEHRHILNIECDGACLECTDVIAATCFVQLPIVRHEINEASREKDL